MATFTNRGGRWTAQVRLRPLKSRAKTFATREQAAEWALIIEKAMRETLEAQAPSGSPIVNLLTPDIQIKADLRLLPRIRLNETATGIYFLFHGDECIYVGQSRNVHARVREHTHHRNGTKQFDSYSWIPCDLDRILEEEARFIRAIRPRLNIQGRRLPMLR